MRPDAPSYVRRKADDELFNGLSGDEFCHVLTSRQMGKSSLMLRTAVRLRDAGITVAILDLTGIGTNLSPEQWYCGLIMQLGDRLDLEDELLAFWEDQAFLGPMQRWIAAIRKVVLPLRAGRLVIFVDEIDAVASLAFSTDEFFAGIRECYNLRNEDGEMNRLTFCLLGVVNPSDLIRNTLTTPFNVGQRIELNDFTEKEALSLAAELGHSAAANCELLKRVFYWTNGHPYLTQRLCQTVSEKELRKSKRELDKSIEEIFFSTRAREHDDNLIFVRERLLRSGLDVTALLNLYSRVRKKKRVADDNTQPLVGALCLSGIARARNGNLRVSNRIYDRVFDKAWIADNLPEAEVRRQAAAFRRGVIRTGAVAGVILLIVISLVLVAVRQWDRALEQIAANKRLVYMANITLANREYESANIPHVEDFVEQAATQGGEDLRGFEWFLFWRYAHNAVQRVKEDGHITSATFYQDLNTLAIARVLHVIAQKRRTYLIDLYDRTLQKESSLLTPPAGANFDIAVFSPDKKYLATDSPEKSVVIWDLARQQPRQTFPGPGAAVSSVVFSPDGKMVAAAFNGGALKVWDIASGAPKLDNQAQMEKPALAFSSDGYSLAVSMSHSSVQIFDLRTRLPFQTFTFPGSLGLLFFSPDGGRLYATTMDGNIYSRNLSDGQIISFIENHSGEITSFTFLPDRKTLVTGSIDRTIKVWDSVAGKQLRVILGHGAAISTLSVSDDGRYLLSGDGDGLIKIWDLNLSELPRWPALRPESVVTTAFTSQNELLALGWTSAHRLTLWNLSKGAVLQDFGEAGSVAGAAFSKDDSMVVIASDSHILVYSVATGKRVSTLTASGVYAYSLEFSPDGRKILSGDRDGHIILSDVSSGKSDWPIDSGNNYYRATFSPDGRRIASADLDGKIVIWDVASRTRMRTLSGHIGVVKQMIFSPGGRLLASAGDDNTVRLWDLDSGNEKHKESHFIERLAFSPDGKRLVTASYERAVILWEVRPDVKDLEEIITLQRNGKGLAPTSVKFSDDGLTLVVSDKAGDVKVWQGARPLGSLN